MWPLRLYPSVLNTWFSCSIATISITSIFPGHNSCYLSFQIPSLYFPPIHLLQSVSINYISLYATVPSITRLDRQAQVNWSAAPYTLHFLLPQFFGPWQEGWEGRLMDKLREASDPAHGCQEGSGDGVLWNTSFTSVYIISFSGTEAAACTALNTHTRTSAKPSIACIQEEISDREKNWIRKYGHRDLWKASFEAGRENTAWSALHLQARAKREEASVLFI